MSKFCPKKHLLSLITVLIFAVSSFVMVSCGSGGGSGYDENPSTNYYKDADTLISVEKLKSWVDNGMKTEDGKPVVVVERSFSDSGTDYDNDSNPDYIPGSVVSSFGSLQETRSDGPVNNPSMILSGPNMNSVLQDCGITKDTVVVFTGEPGWIITRGWWTFYYWGFSEENIKVLDGGTKAYFNAGYYTTNNLKDPQPSNFEISDLPYASDRAERIDEARVPIGKMVEHVRKGDAAIIATVPGKGYNFFNGKIEGSQRAFPVYKEGFYNSDGTFKPAEDIAQMFASNGVELPEDKNARIIVYCNKANLASLYYYIIKEILGYNNVASYDGAWSEWTGLIAQHSSDVSATNGGGTFKYDEQSGEFVYEDTGAVVPNIVDDGTISIEKFNTLKLSEEIQLNESAGSMEEINAFIANSEVDKNYSGLGKEVNEEDKNFILNSSGGDALPEEAVSGGGSAGGC